MRIPWYLMAKAKGGGDYKTASGPIVSVNDALAAPLRSLLVGIEPVQDLHGYQNPWPAGGGKNLLDYSTAIKTTTSVKFDTGITLTANQAYTFGYFGSDNVSIICYIHSTDTRLFTSGYTKAYTYTPTEDVACDIMFYNSPSITAAENLFQLEKGYSKTTFAPYSNICPISGWSECKVWLKSTYDPTANPTATIQLGDTYYGGTLDVTNGVLTVTHQFRTYMSVGAVYTHSSNSHYWTITLSQPISINTTAETRDNYSSNMFICQTGVVPGNFYVTSNGGTIVLVPWSDQQAITTKEQADAWLADNPVEVCIPLATPVTIQLTPTEIMTLLGQNNVWADNGDVTVTYLASGGTDPNLMKLAVAFMGRK